MELPKVTPITASRQHTQAEILPTPAEFLDMVCQQLAEAKISYTFSDGQIYCSPEDLQKVIEITSQQLHNKQLQGTIFVNQ